MILDGTQRGSCKEMGRHLLNREVNDVVEVHEIGGFIADTIPGAMLEVEAITRGTKAEKPLFSVSLSPPPRESVRVEVFEDAINRIERANGLDGQPRIVVFHEKDGRRHCHAVWSRIDAETMTARQLSHFKLKLREVSRELYLEHGWQMPKGLMNSKERDPRNFTLDQWQQAKRMGRDAGELRGIVQECFAVSDSRKAFAGALEERGLYLAKGDRRGHVALTYEGEVISVARYAGRKAKEVEARFGKPDDLPSVETTREKIASVIVPRLHAMRGQADQEKLAALADVRRERLSLRERHAQERAAMDSGQEARCQTEACTRAERMRHGVRGLWDRLTGEAARITRLNETEAFAALARDRAQRQHMIEAQLREQHALHKSAQQIRARHSERLAELHRDLARQMGEPLPNTERTADTSRASPMPPRVRLAERFARLEARNGLEKTYRIDLEPAPPPPIPDRLRERFKRIEPRVSATARDPRSFDQPVEPATIRDRLSERFARRAERDASSDRERGPGFDLER